MPPAASSHSALFQLSIDKLRYILFMTLAPDVSVMIFLVPNSLIFVPRDYVWFG